MSQPAEGREDCGRWAAQAGGPSSLQTQSTAVSVTVHCTEPPGASGIDPARDIMGISKLARIQLLLPYKIRCIKVSLEIPLLSLMQRASLYTAQNHPVPVA